MATPKIAIDRERLADFCRQHHIRRLQLFGSVLRDDFRPDSDVDVLVEFEPGHTPGWGIMDVEEELGRLLGGRKVDMVNPRYLNRRLRDRILHDAQVQYDPRMTRSISVICSTRLEKR
jgi:predicted nucleotidyltransferase